MSESEISVKSIIRRANGRKMVIDGMAVYGSEKRLLTVSCVRRGEEIAVIVDGKPCRTMKTKMTVDKAAGVLLRRMAREYGIGGIQ